MMLAMPRSVYITTPRPSYETLVKQLRIPKARRKQLDAIFEEARKRLTAERQVTQSDLSEAEENLQIASAAR